jgi:hypothetical protein
MPATKGTMKCAGKYSTEDSPLAASASIRSNNEYRIEIGCRSGFYFINMGKIGVQRFL